MTIKVKHPAREAFSGRSTGNNRGAYYETKGHAVNAFDNELQSYDMWLDRDDLADFYGDEGRKTIDIYQECGGAVGCAVLSWYRMPSGRYEFVGYIA
jgi:hypothetical protein